MLSLPVKQGQIYYVVELRCLYKDFGPSSYERSPYPAIVVNTDYERLNRLRPANGVNCYVIENNQLWLYDTRWVLKDGDIRKYNSYSYTNNGLSPVVNPDENITSSVTGDRIIDNNGLLGDGSVAVRDYNRIIRGTLSSNLERSQLEISSLLDNGILLRPYGVNADNSASRYTGALHLSVQAEHLSAESGDSYNLVRNGIADYYGDLYIHGDIYTYKPVDPLSYNISVIPTENQRLIHKFSYIRDNSNESAFEYSDVVITVAGEDSIKVTITEYTRDSDKAVTDENGVIKYVGNIISSKSITYDAERGALNSDLARAAYIVDDGVEGLYFILVGTPISAEVTIGNHKLDAPLELPSQTIYASTELVNVVNISKLLSKLCEATGVIY